MKTLTVRLPESLVAEIDAESRDRRMSKSDVIRERLQVGARVAGGRSPVLETTEDLLGARGAPALSGLLRRGAVIPSFELAGNLEAVLGLMAKYADVPASLADASLVRMTETIDGPIVLTTDADFRFYRRHGRQVVPCV